MEPGALGREYEDREVICRQGDRGDCMYVIQSGTVDVLHQDGGAEVLVGTMKAGEIVGEMALFDRQPRSATVRARGAARVLTLDKRAFLRRVHEDPSLAFRLLETMSQRIRALNTELASLKQAPAATEREPARLAGRRG
ncbi:MAG: cyclic nucleotide-binding domain-containing protein [Chloroflexi bacterium]|nr:cyclic nucleotide-binding domain-containing protein [Chloroflexota bacterium]